MNPAYHMVKSSRVLEYKRPRVTVAVARSGLHRAMQGRRHAALCKLFFFGPLVVKVPGTRGQRRWYAGSGCTRRRGTAGMCSTSPRFVLDQRLEWHIFDELRRQQTVCQVAGANAAGASAAAPPGSRRVRRGLSVRGVRCEWPRSSGFASGRERRRVLGRDVLHGTERHGRDGTV